MWGWKEEGAKKIKDLAKYSSSIFLKSSSHVSKELKWTQNVDDVGQNGI